MLRLDVSAEPYAVPADNPFVGVDGVLPEIWAYGLRNPWRYLFDEHGRMVVADVGQNTWEEVGFLAAGDNAGWSVREGGACHGKAQCPREGFRDPFWVYGRDEGGSVTGGVIAPAGLLAGAYVFGDYVSGRIWALQLPRSGNEAVDRVRPLGHFGVHPATFGVQGESLLVADHLTGSIYRIVGEK
jgi:hypothetical protein